MSQADFVIPPGTGIAIVAPGGYPPDEAALARGIKRLEQQNCLVHNYYDPADKYQRFGGIDMARVAQLHAAADDPDVQIVMALRGGYGLSRILPMLDFDFLANSGKLFVGYSDFTVFHMALLAATGKVSFAGPMVCGDFGCERPSDYTLSHFWQILTRPGLTLMAHTPNNPCIEAEGVLWGGNLAMLTHLLGSPYFPRIEGGILFIEDVNEHPYRIERMLVQLLHAGVLARQQAILLGDFSAYRLSEYDNGYDFNAMLAYIRSRVATPILTGLPFGHCADKLTLPVGSRAQLVSEKNTFRLQLAEYPVLAG
ncbi:muramoyltetrapeptide carboxypeptidase [Paucimonas lemoignei]|uniref:Muramoyltetrapeptide carboxypeptidase n=1 Tax=Paucimonas lemoignei TaxID=29443 RepID=A0A4R3I191_PAULE|nr:muramoyltetrapeptide carboxypeptidase [Paucimonas lemoignei]TCS39506.1 muramoyltetrapeptide carboxypeptidase [Paucimonas lemoignei]